MSVQPGADFNYPTSSGNVPAGLMGASFTINGWHISVVTILIVLALILVWNLAKKRRR